MSNYHRILCVDDDKDTCELISWMLRQDDYSCAVKFAYSAAEALNYLEQESFDLYILDNRLPDMTGIDLCSRIRQSDKQSPIMFFSALARDVDRKMAILSGASDYLVKPNDLDRFSETVRQLLNQSKLTARRKVHARKRCSEIV
ncbi:MAG: response regulator with CheY-like receiver domain and winged-helix DNA-binding domain [Acidobacteria bacterium]|jgi:two-component system alkaline phosphatase synthesis response regulator PhoP|nr:response regulator with CheY-like receiver domain and winged-helix DNA-binding domain [Acidobacteriota bacterium]